MQHTIAVAAGIVVVATLALASWSWVRAASESARPVIAITDITSASGDSASAWLETGVAQMLATDLARYSSVEIIEPRRVRDVRVRAQLPLTGSLPEQQAAELARRVGATLVVRGTLTAGGGGYALSLIERDVRTGRTVTSFNIVAPDPISLADQATSRLLDAGAGDGARASRPRFAEVQTPSAEAYQHFVRGEQAGVEGRFAEQRRELDLAIALDSGFGSALLARMKAATPAEWPDVRPALARSLAHARFTNWDMQQQAVDSALHNGEYQRSERLAEGLVTRYPHDARL